MKILAIIPAYNEEKSIKNVILDITSNFENVDVLVINDCSSDRTADIARDNGAKVISLPYNLGIGGAVQTGFLYAKENNYDIAFQFDGDGQHLGKEISKIIEPIVANKADMVIGSRFLDIRNYTPPLFRKIGIAYFSILNSLIVKKKLTDNTSGFRAYNKAAISYLARNYPQDYPEVEAIIVMSRAEFNITEIPVSMRERQGGRSSITFYKSIYYMIKVTFSVLINLFRQHPKRNPEEIIWN